MKTNNLYDDIFILDPIESLVERLKIKLLEMNYITVTCDWLDVTTNKYLMSNNFKYLLL